MKPNYRAEVQSEIARINVKAGDSDKIRAFLLETALNALALRADVSLQPAQVPDLIGADMEPDIAMEAIDATLAAMRMRYEDSDYTALYDVERALERASEALGKLSVQVAEREWEPEQEIDA